MSGQGLLIAVVVVAAAAAVVVYGYGHDLRCRVWLFCRALVFCVVVDYL